MKSLTSILLLIILIPAGFAQNAAIKTQHFESNFTQLDSTYILIPISWSSNGEFNNFKIESSSEYKMKNLIFYNITNDSCRYLFSDSLQIIRLIKAYNYGQNYTGFSLSIIKDSVQADLELNRNNSQTKYTFNDFMLYEVINEDYNEDEKLSTEDPVYLYASANDGSGLKQITPRCYSYRYFQHFEKEKMLLAVLIMDSNADKKFDNNDREVIYKIDLEDFANSKIVLDIQIKKKP